MHATGTCYCGETAFEIDVEAEGGGVFCYCVTCQKLANDRSYNVKGDLSTLKNTKGEPKVYDDTKPDCGKAVKRAFCGTCGSGLYSTPSSMENVVFVKIGSLDIAKDIKPAAEIYVESALPQSKLDDSPSVKRFEGMMAKPLN